MLDDILNKIKNIFSSEDHSIELMTSSDEVAEFLLNYQQLKVGTLTLNKGVWSFRYAEEFKNQHKIISIVDFPDRDKLYTSEVLFPFFSSRIPSLERLKLQEIVPKDTKPNQVMLLKMFGKQSIANPYHLIAVN